jgi:leucyl-tRNA synthetase
MNGYNTLFSFAFHATGSPIISSARAIEKNDKSQLDNLKTFGITDKEEIEKFKNPNHWVKYFIKEWEKDLFSLGFSVDSRTHLITTDLNKSYDKFIRWQFNKLKEKNYVKKGKHPVIWCSSCKEPIGDHSRHSGEGETAQEYTLLKFELIENDYLKDKVYLVAATLRPETVYGQTNFWIDADGDYSLIEIEYDNKKENWITSQKSIEKLEDQEKKIKVIKEIKGEELILKHCIAPLVNTKIPILPADFISASVGTGLVTSVPSDAPHDYIALEDLKNKREFREKYNIPEEEVKKIEVIRIIDSKELGDFPAKTVCEDLNISSQFDHRLEDAKKIVYRQGFHTGILNKNCGQYKGMSVEEAKEQIKQRLIKENLATIFFEPSGKVICRCKNQCHVKVVENQWFIEYNNPEWKEITHEAVDKMTFYPEKVRKQFHHVIDWLQHWACTREIGLGTKLPWDEKWLIESLSDSTIQMAYFPIAKYLQYPEENNIIVENLTDIFFDYIYLEKGDLEKVSIETKIPKEKITQIKEEVDYWLPHDYRNSAKDLIQNHLTFSLFNFTGIFPEKYWPKAYEINGMVLVDSEKMGKSKGNFYTARQLLEKYPADYIRLTAAYSGEGMDDSNFEFGFIDTAKQKLNFIKHLVLKNYNQGSTEMNFQDKWFESKIHSFIKEATDMVENLKYRSYVQKVFLESINLYKEYLAKVEKGNKDIQNYFIEALVKMISPITPFVAEELWEQLGKKTLVSNETWPIYDDSKINENIEYSYELSERIIEDINTIKGLVKINKLKKIELFVSQEYKYELFRDLKKLLASGLGIPEITKEIMPKYAKYDKNLSKKIEKLISKIPHPILSQKEEYNMLIENKDKIEKCFKASVEINKLNQDSTQEVNAMPFKVGIRLE